MSNRYGSYLAYNYDQDHTNALGCQYTNETYPGGVDCDVMEDKITVLNIVMALFGPVSLNIHKMNHVDLKFMRFSDIGCRGDSRIHHGVVGVDGSTRPAGFRSHRRHRPGQR